MPKREAELGEFEKQMNAPDFWDDPDAAQKVVAKMKRTKAGIEPIQAMLAGVEDVRAMIELA
ncbi:MAG: peptide chain release factor 2, partial [Planctomycetota bacterium]